MWREVRDVSGESCERVGGGGESRESRECWGYLQVDSPIDTCFSF